MFQNFNKSISLAISGLLLAAAAAPVMAADIVTSPVTAAPQTTARYWTAARKATAIAMPLREVSGKPVAATGPLVTGRPGAVVGNPPAGVKAPAAEGGAAVQPQFPGDGTDTIWYDYPPPYDSYLVPFAGLRTLFPLSTLGKLFFTDGVYNYVCSAQSVTSAGEWGEGNRQTVITAGHCCSSGDGSFYSNWVFEPAHHQGQAPLGSWTAAFAVVYTDWHVGSDLSVDYCGLQMYTLDGRNINDAVGALGYTWNQPLPQQYTASGWPAGAPYTGGVLVLDHASDAETDTEQAGAVAYTHGIGNPMTGGSSGGAWIRGYSLNPNKFSQYFNGLNSYKYTSPNRPLEMFGPYVEDLFVDLLEYVALSPAAP